MDAKDENGKVVVQRISTVTLEATPKIAEKIAVAQTIGTLSLSLRSIADNSAELERAIASGEVTVPENADPRAERRMLLAIANQPVDTGSTYTVGADVSRFQRSSVPGRAREEKSDPDRDLARAFLSAATERGQASSAGSSAPAAARGPVVRVARGNNVTLVPVGAK